MFERIVVLAARSGEDSHLHRAAARIGKRNAFVSVVHSEANVHRGALDELLGAAASANADLIVLGAKSHATARRAAMLAPCSVLMAPDRVELELDRILVPVDLSETSAAALREGARLALAHAGTVTALSVETDDDPWLDWHDYPSRLPAILEEFVAKHVGEGVPVECLVEPASVSPEAAASDGAATAASIVEVAKRTGASLIVIGTRGRTRASSILLGSVTEKVVQMSPVPVLAVRQHRQSLGLLEGILQRLGHAPEPLVAS